MMLPLLLSFGVLQEPGGLWTEERHVEGTIALTRLGFTADFIGDLNHDGHTDYILGAPDQNNFGITLAGSAYVIDGASGLILREHQGTTYGGLLGWQVAGVGDLNHDGTCDYAAGEAGTGDSVFLYDGSSGSTLVKIMEPPGNSSFGSAVEGVGDWNYDGTPDVAVSDYFATINGMFAAGVVYIYSGMDGSLLQQINGQASGQTFGRHLCGGGDYNGDGVQDLLVHALWYYGSAIHVLSGGTGAELYRLDSPTGSDALGNAMDFVPDMDGDGCDEILAGAIYTGSMGASWGAAYLFSGRTGSLIRAWYGEQPFNGVWGSNFGSAVSCAGDLDRDGVPDFVIADNQFGEYRFYTSEGKIYFYSGADGRLLHSILGTYIYSGLGEALDGGEDLTGDGWPDVLITDPAADLNGLPDVGAAYVYSYDPFLDASDREISASAGGTVTFTLDFPASEAGREYRLLASTDRTDKPWLTVRGIGVPLAETSLVYRTWNHPPPGAQGVLDASGDATVTLNLSPGTAAAEIGRTFRFAAVSLAGPGQPGLSSGATLLSILP